MSLGCEEEEEEVEAEAERRKGGEKKSAMMISTSYAENKQLGI